MFRASHSYWKALTGFVDDVLADHPAEGGVAGGEVVAAPAPPFDWEANGPAGEAGIGTPVALPHPHRRPLRSRRVRRPGMVAAAPAHCISPVSRPAVTPRMAPATARDTSGTRQ